MNRTTSLSPDHVGVVFAKLYYGIPCFRGNEPLFVGDASIKLDEPIDAILWFLDLKSAHTPETACPKALLKTLVMSWHSGERSFERDYGELLSQKFIDAQDNEGDRRGKDVWLTKSGQKLLAEIRQQRLRDIDFIQREFLALPENEQRVVWQWLNSVAETAWQLMNQSNAEKQSVKKKKPKTSTAARRKFSAKRGTRSP